jgi:hypothetical protein
MNKKTLKKHLKIRVIDAEEIVIDKGLLEERRMMNQHKTVMGYNKGSIINNDSVEGETLEQKIERIMSNKEPIKDGAPLIHTERKDGVEPAYNIKTDRFDIAIDAMDIVTKSTEAKRDYKASLKVVKDEEKSGNPESSDGTNNEIK